MDDESTQINLLQKLYKDKNSGLFLLKNTQDIYREAKRHAELASVTRETIEKFKVSSLSLSCRGIVPVGVGGSTSHIMMIPVENDPVGAWA